MSEENENKSHRGILMVIAVVIAIPLLYVLSIGPAEAIATKYPKCEPVFHKFYFPLGWLAVYTPLGKPLKWYVRLWI